MPHRDKEDEPMPYGAVQSPGEEEAVEATEKAEARDAKKPPMPFLSPGEEEAVEATEDAEQQDRKKDD